MCESRTYRQVLKIYVDFKIRLKRIPIIYTIIRFVTNPAEIQSSFPLILILEKYIKSKNGLDKTVGIGWVWLLITIYLLNFGFFLINLKAIYPTKISKI